MQTKKMLVNQEIDYKDLSIHFFFLPSHVGPSSFQPLLTLFWLGMGTFNPPVKNSEISKQLKHFFHQPEFVTDIICKCQPPRPCRTNIMLYLVQVNLSTISKSQSVSYKMSKNSKLDNLCSVCANDLILYSSFASMSKMIFEIRTLKVL